MKNHRNSIKEFISHTPSHHTTHHTPHMSLKDAFSNIPFTTKKHAIIEEVKGLYSKLQQCASKTQVALFEKNQEFSRIGTGLFEQVCLDPSITGRTEFTLSCESNRNLAYLGDSYLSLFIASAAYENNQSATEFQNLRSKFSSRNHLGDAAFPALFGTTPVTLCWPLSSSPTRNQKAEFIEALIGMLHEASHEDLADWLCWFILSL